MKKGLFWFYNFDDSLFTYAVPSDNDESLSFQNCCDKVGERSADDEACRSDNYRY